MSSPAFHSKGLFDLLVDAGIPIPPNTRSVTVCIEWDNAVTITYDCYADKRIEAVLPGIVKAAHDAAEPR